MTAPGGLHAGRVWRAALYVSLMAGYERMQRVHREHEVPAEVIADTLSQIEHYYVPRKRPDDDALRAGIKQLAEDRQYYG